MMGAVCPAVFPDMKAGMAGRHETNRKDIAMTAENQIQSSQTENANAPDWVVKTPKGYGRKAKLERIGVAWNRANDGGICVRLAGTQIIAEDIYLFPINAEQADA